MAFVLKQTIDLSSFGWADCSITVQSLTYNEAQEARDLYKSSDSSDPKTQKSIFDFIESKFISGTALNEKDEKVEITKEQLGDLPIQVYVAVIEKMVGKTDPNL